jgi:DNA-binding Lrp family transcriptional regulator
MYKLTDFDKELLNILQGNIPLVSRPFAYMAEKLGCGENEVIEEINLLKREGYVRRIGSFFNSDKLGYRGTLVALKVKRELMEETAFFINKYPGITHNYEREGEYNLWFTLLTPDDEVRQKIMYEITSLPGVEKYMDLSARRKYKINVQFMLK